MSPGYVLFGLITPLPRAAKGSQEPAGLWENEMFVIYDAWKNHWMIYYLLPHWVGSTLLGRKRKVHIQCQVTEQMGSVPQFWLWLVEQVTTPQ